MENRTLLDVVQEHCKDHELDLSKFLQNLLVMRPHAGNSASIQLQHIRGHLKNMNISKHMIDGTLRANLNLDIVMLHFLFDVSLDLFGLPKDDPLILKIIENRKQPTTKVYQLETLGYGNYGSREEAAKKYLNAASELMEHFNGKCYIYDLLERFNTSQDVQKREYLDMHKKIYAQIENRLFKSQNVQKEQTKQEKPRFEYSRFLSLPNGKCLPKTHWEYNTIEITKEIIEHCPPSLFEHILFCLSKNRSYETPDSSRTRNNGFYAVGVPFRDYHYAILNNSQFCYTEYYKRDDEGMLRPDLLFVDNTFGYRTELSEIYSNEIRFHLRSSRFPKMTLRNIRLALNELNLNGNIEQTAWTQINSKYFNKFLSNDINEELRREIEDIPK